MKRGLLVLVAFVVAYFAFRSDRVKGPSGLELIYKKKEFNAPNASSPVVFVLHGHGADEDDLVPAMSKVQTPFTAYFFRGPESAGLGRSWAYGKGDDAVSAQVNYWAGLNQVVSTLVQASRVFSGSSGAPYLLGFSLGGTVALLAALNEPAAFKDIFVIAGSPPAKLSFPENNLDRPKKVWLFHSPEDQVVSISVAKSAFAFFKENKTECEMMEYVGGHRTSPEVLAKITQILASRP